MKIIITGASGFVGKNLSKHLKENKNDVVKLSLRNEDWTLDKTSDVVIHLAGKAHDTKNVSKEIEYFLVNTELTKQVFDRFIDSDIQDFIYFSSVKAVADEVEEILCEDVVSNPKTPYGKSKLEAEHYLLSKNLPQGKRLFIIRPCMIHGPGNKGNLNLLYRIVGKGIPWPLAAFKNKRSFLSIDNLNFIIEKIINNTSISSGIYNVADDEPISTNQLIKIISRTLNKKTNTINIPKKQILILAKIGDFTKLPLNSERLQKLTENYVVSNSKIKKALAIESLPFNVEEGIEKTVKSFINK